MTVTINGATGIAGVNGTAVIPAMQGSDTNTGVFYGTDIVAVSTGGTERMRINASGQTEFTAGTAALPAITATGDTNTGVFYPAADTVAISTGGTERMRVTSTGVNLNGSTSGTLTIAAPAVAGTNTITFPAATDTVATLAATQTLTNKTIQGGVITSATAQASTSGTAITFTGIPSYVKRITVMFSSVSTNGSSGYKLRIGPSAGVETSGYLGLCNAEDGTNATNPTTSFLITPSTSLSAASIIQGKAELLNFSGNTWVCVSQVGRSDAAGTGSQLYASGTKPLAGVLTQIEISTANGTDTFDAGSINIMYE